MAPQPWADILAGVLGGKANMAQSKAVKRAVKVAMEQSSEGEGSKKRLKKELRAALSSGSVPGFAVEDEQVQKVPVLAAAPAADAKKKEKKRKREAPAAAPADDAADEAGPSSEPLKRRKEEKKEKKEKENAGQGRPDSASPDAPRPAAQPDAVPAAANNTAIEVGGAVSDSDDGEDTKWRASNQRADVKSGAFSEAEKDLIRQGVEEFARAKGHSTEDYSWILGRGGRGNKPAGVKGLWKAVAKALPHRTIKAVAGAGNRMFHPDAYKGAWKPEDDAELKDEVANRGPQWQAIGVRLGRHREACRLRWRDLKLGDAKAYGQWTTDEEQRLEIAVKEFLDARKAAEAAAGENALQKLDRRQVLDDINWDAISQRVRTRTHIQCLSKWYDQMAPSMVERGDWGTGDDRRLLRALWASGATAEFEVDWGTVVGGRTAAQARRRWRLMAKAVPDARDKEFDEIVDHLVTRFMPHLKERAAAAAAAEGEGAAEEGEGADAEDGSS